MGSLPSAARILSHPACGRVQPFFSPPCAPGGSPWLPQPGQLIPPAGTSSWLLPMVSRLPGDFLKTTATEAWALLLGPGALPTALVGVHEQEGDLPVLTTPIPTSLESAVSSLARLSRKGFSTKSSFTELSDLVGGFTLWKKKTRPEK